MAAGGFSKLNTFNTTIEGFTQIDFANHDKIKKAVNDNTAAILIEPIQGEAGIKEVPLEFLVELRSLCDEKNILLIFDEVQCGLGRTGKLFAHHWSDIKPDIMTIAKAIGNGFPLGACLTSKKVGEVMDFGSHGSTFGGNPLASVVGNSVLDIMLEESFFINLEVVSKELFEGLAEIQNEFPKVIDTIRGKGLMIGIRCNVSNSVFVDKARSNKLLTIKASDNVVRLLPPLILKSNECKEGLSKIKATCEMF
jgi:acetylornithine/N-succinyldiaminopimelate aminotransferase